MPVDFYRFLPPFWGTVAIHTFSMLIDEELIKKSFGKLLKSGVPHFYRRGTLVENAKCTHVLLLNLSKIEEDNGITFYNVTGTIRLEALITPNDYKESPMTIESKIQVVGDEILDNQNIRVDLKG